MRKYLITTSWSAMFKYLNCKKNLYGIHCISQFSQLIKIGASIHYFFKLSQLATRDRGDDFNRIADFYSTSKGRSPSFQMFHGIWMYCSVYQGSLIHFMFSYSFPQFILKSVSPFIKCHDYTCIFNVGYKWLLYKVYWCSAS